MAIKNTAYSYFQRLFLNSSFYQWWVKIFISSSAIHDQGSENVCWAYAISTMLRASIRSALKKYKTQIAFKVIKGNLSSSMFESELVKIEKSLKILDDRNHHKMMRKELSMNVFPFGDDGTDPSIVIKLVCNTDFTGILSIMLIWFSAKDGLEFAKSRYLPASHSHFDFWRFWIRNATFRQSENWNRRERDAFLFRNFWRRSLIFFIKYKTSINLLIRKECFFFSNF